MTEILRDWQITMLTRLIAAQLEVETDPSARANWQTITQDLRAALSENRK